MENLPFRSRIAELIQKSRKALRLYSNMGRLSNQPATEFNEMQIREWREVNADLLKELSAAYDHPNGRRLVGEVFALRDRFYANWREYESILRQKQRELINAAEKGDFIKVAIWGRELVILKAREQAVQAAHHELQDVIKRSKIAQPTIELSDDHVITEPPEPPAQSVKQVRVDMNRAAAPDVAPLPEPPLAKIIPLRGR